MSLKISLILNIFKYFLFALMLLGGTSCAPRGIAPSQDPVFRSGSGPVSPAKPEEKQPSIAEEKSNPRMIASLQLTQQAQSLIATRQADSAIRILERAVSIDPSNGQNYYYLSEAWLIKGNTAQAMNFNDLALIHLRSDEKWRKRITDQRHRIKNQTGSA